MEVIISIVLLGMVAAVGTSMLKDTFDTARTVNADNASAGQARYALERLAREIREVKFASTSNGTTCSNATSGYCITAPATLPAPASPLTVSSAAPLTFDNGANASVSITVTTDANGLTKTLNLNGYALCSNVTSLLAVFYDISDSAAAPTMSTVRFVQLTLTVTDPTSGQITAQRTRVALRNE